MRRFLCIIGPIALGLLLLTGCSTQRGTINVQRATIDSLQSVVDTLQLVLRQRDAAEARLVQTLDTTQAALDTALAREKALRTTLETHSDSLRKALLEQFVRGMEAQQLLRGTTLDIVYFEPGSDRITPATARRLDRLAARLRGEAAGRTILVEGHSDDTPFSSGGERINNRLLSAQRAAAVVRYFTEHHSLPERRFEAAGYGSDKPVAPNNMPEGRRLNRRVRIAVL